MGPAPVCKTVGGIRPLAEITGNAGECCIHQKFFRLFIIGQFICCMKRQLVKISFKFLLGKPVSVLCGINLIFAVFCVDQSEGLIAPADD